MNLNIVVKVQNIYTILQHAILINFFILHIVVNIANSLPVRTVHLEKAPENIEALRIRNLSSDVLKLISNKRNDFENDSSLPFQTQQKDFDDESTNLLKNLFISSALQRFKTRGRRTKRNSNFCVPIIKCHGRRKKHRCQMIMKVRVPKHGSSQVTDMHIKTCRNLFKSSSKRSISR